MSLCSLPNVHVFGFLLGFHFVLASRRHSLTSKECFRLISRGSSQSVHSTFLQRLALMPNPTHSTPPWSTLHVSQSRNYEQLSVLSLIPLCWLILFLSAKILFFSLFLVKLILLQFCRNAEEQVALSVFLFCEVIAPSTNFCYNVHCNIMKLPLQVYEIL